jgi:hypothetical protein
MEARNAASAIIVTTLFAFACVGAKADELAFAYRDTCALERFGPSKITAGTEFAPPIEIIKGGVYRGNWRSDNPKQPVIRIRTKEPVIIEDSILVGRGNLVEGSAGRVIVRRTRGFGLDPGVPGLKRGRFVSLANVSDALVYDNYLEELWGIRFDGFDRSRPSGTVRIIGNRGCNIIGAPSDGQGGLQSGDGGAHFAQLANSHRVPNGEIAWNVVINQPFKSRIGDVINLFNSGGAEGEPFRVHNNFIDGAYPADAANDKYSGGGILLGDGAFPPAAPDTVSSYVLAYDNHVLSTSNYGVAIAAGHNNRAFRNRVFATGFLARDGRFIRSQNVGVYVWNIRKDPTTFFGNAANDNLVAWVHRSKEGRIAFNNTWTPDCALDEQGKSLCQNNRKLDLSCAAEDCTKAELDLWATKFESARPTLLSRPQ